MHAYFHVLCQGHPELLVLTSFTLVMLENGNPDVSAFIHIHASTINHKFIFAMKARGVLS